jgi:nucleoside-diphosphate-sugar epimerase
VKNAMDGIDTVYHLAALISIPYSYRAVERYVNTNIMGTQNEISIGELAQYLINEINPSAQIVTDEKRLRPTTSEVFKLLGSNDKLFQHTKWKPEMNIEIGLKNTIEWFRLPENYKKYNPNIYSI